MAVDEQDVLINLLRSSDDTNVPERVTCDEAIACFDNVCIKPGCEVYARPRLNTCKQKSDETIDEQGSQFFDLKTSTFDFILTYQFLAFAMKRGLENLYQKSK